MCWWASAWDFAGTPASRSLTGSVPVTRAGMASGTADLQRDLGGAVMQSIFGALLTAGYAAAATAALAGAPPSADFTTSVQNQLTMSFAGAADIAQQYPQYSTQILQAAKESFLAGDQWAYLAGIVAVLLGAALVFLKFPQAGRGASPAGRIPRPGRRGSDAAAGEARTRSGPAITGMKGRATNGPERVRQLQPGRLHDHRPDRGDDQCLQWRASLRGSPRTTGSTRSSASC